MKEYIRKNLVGFITLIASLLLAIGAVSFFAACGPNDEGEWMTCHYAQNIVALFGLLLAVLSLLRLCLPDRFMTDRGLLLAIATSALCCMFVPGILIPLCMMETMRCHAIMRPASIVLCTIIFICALFDFFKKSVDR